MSKPLLTVVIPVTRMAGKLWNLKLTLAAAADEDVLVILVHDIADSETSDQLIKVVTAIPQLKFILEENHFGNPGDARNAGLKYVSGGWFAFWDSDDLPNVREFTSMIARASENGADVAIGGIETCYFGFENETRGFPAPSVDSRNSVFNLAQMPAFTRMAFRNLDLTSVNFPPLSMGEDLIFLARSKFLDRKTYVHSKSVYLYVLNFPGQLTGDPSKLKQVSKIWKYLHEESKKTAGTMQSYITFQIFKNQLAALKTSHRLTLPGIGWSLFRFIKSPILTVAIIMYILKNQNLLERKTEH